MTWYLWLILGYLVGSQSTLMALKRIAGYRRHCGLVLEPWRPGKPKP